MNTAHPRHQWLFIVLPSLCLGLLIFIPVAMFWHTYGGDPYGKETFSRARWHQNGSAGRDATVKDLLSNHLKPGLSKGQVESLLGRPTAITDSKGQLKFLHGRPMAPTAYPSEERWEYELGPTSSGLDSRYLLLRFDKQGLLVDGATGDG